MGSAASRASAQNSTAWPLRSVSDATHSNQITGNQEMDAVHVSNHQMVTDADGVHG